MFTFADTQKDACGSWPDRFWNLILGRPKDLGHEFHPSSACQSDIGGRDENQDRCLRDDEAAVYLVVDGMGGYQGGALASQIAIDVIGDRIRAACKNNPSHESMQAALHDALIEAQHAMSEKAEKHPELRRMGCTLAAAAVIADRVFYTHIGDSRVYLVHGGRIKRLTRDETILEEMVAAKLLAKNDAVTHRWRHVVTNSLSMRGCDYEPQWEELKLSEGDQILLTSDGLTDELADDEIAHRMRHASSPQQSVQDLIREALDRNAKDNVTCVVTEMQRDVHDS